MKITIIAGGSRGDVQPYVALGTGLKAAGHTVRVVTSQDFQALVRTYGLDYVGMGGSAEALAQQQFKGLAEQGNVLRILASTGRGARQLAKEGAISGLAVSQDADLIIGGLGGLFVGLALAQKLGIPYIQAYLYPLTPTIKFPSTLTPLPETRLLGWANRLSHRAMRQLMWQMFRAADTKARTEVLQMAPAPFWGPFAPLERQAHPLLYGYSPHVVPRPTDWVDGIHVTGYWFLDPPRDWVPPADPMPFLESGPPPIYIGFGSMLSSTPEATADLVVQALTRSGQRGVVYGGWGGLKATHLPETVFVTESVPHTWLFPHMAAVVHHGGAGTTCAALRAGVPSITIPFFGDQPFWAQRVSTLGVGPRAIARRRLTVDNLAEAMQVAVSNRGMRQRAADLGERIRAENGIARAVAIIERTG